MSTHHATAPPANKNPEIRGPMMNPTPKRAGVQSMLKTVFSNLEMIHEGVSLNRKKALEQSLCKEPTMIPKNVINAFVRKDSPDFKISAQAVPSGKGSLPCSLTMM